jgi:hypothetical protein
MNTIRPHISALCPPARTTCARRPGPWRTRHTLPILILPPSRIRGSTPSEFVVVPPLSVVERQYSGAKYHLLVHQSQYSGAKYHLLVHQSSRAVSSSLEMLLRVFLTSCLSLHSVPARGMYPCSEWHSPYIYSLGLGFRDKGQGFRLHIHTLHWNPYELSRVYRRRMAWGVVSRCLGL